MWFQKLGRDRRRPWTAAGLGATLLLAVVSGSCAPDYVTGNDSPVNLIVAAINGGAVLDSDVRMGQDSSFVCPDEVPVAVAVRNKNPNGPVSVVPSHVLISSYEVRYFRTDGRGTEGVDVPFRVTGALSAEVDVATSGTSDIPIEVVRRQAKVEPPLSSVFQATVLTVIAQVTLYGQTIGGQRVTASGQMQIDFADYGDKLTACPNKQ